MNNNVIDDLVEKTLSDASLNESWPNFQQELSKNGTLYLHAFAEKFARLIIQECMTVADLPNSADGKYDAFLPSEMIAKHFGANDAMES